MEFIIKWVLILVVLWFIVRQFLPATGVKSIPAHELKSKYKDKTIQFIDVRNLSEYNIQHEEPFQNIPVSKIKKQSNTLNKRQEVVVICQTGIRSKRAAKILKSKGFEKVTNVTGGMSALK